MNSFLITINDIVYEGIVKDFSHHREVDPQWGSEKHNITVSVEFESGNNSQFFKMEKCSALMLTDMGEVKLYGVASRSVSIIDKICRVNFTCDAYYPSYTSTSLLEIVKKELNL